MYSRFYLAITAFSVGFAGKHEGGHHSGGKKHESYGVGYVEEGGVVGYSCHEGWEPQGQGPTMVCVNQEKLPLLPTCPVGILEGNQCLLSEPAIFTCPPGFVEVGGYGGKKHGGKKHGGGHESGKKHGGGGPLCMKVDRIPFEPYCPMGATFRNGQCMRMEIAPATMICPLDNYGGKHGGHAGKHDGGKKHGFIEQPCVETVDVGPILTCPPNLTLEGTVCIGFGQGPCPIAPPAPLILDSKKHKHGGHGGHSGYGGNYRRLAPDGSLDEPLGGLRDTELLAEGDEETNASIAEVRGEEVAESIAAGIAQDLGVGESEGERLLGEKHGGHHGGKKHESYGAPVLAMVPSKQKFCDLEIIEPAIPACPPGSYEALGYGGGKDKKKKHSHGSTGLICAQNVNIPLEPYCPMGGAILRPDTMTCESQLFENELTRCPLGFEPCNLGGGKKKHHGGHGGHGGNGGYGGYGLNDAGCCAVQYADPIPGCPLSAELIGAQCLIFNEPIFECPQNAIREHDKCYVIRTKPPKIHYQINVTTKQAPAPLVQTGKKHKKHH